MKVSGLMKKIAGAALALALLFGGTLQRGAGQALAAPAAAATNAGQSVLPVGFVPQTTPVTCWAASIAMVTGYKTGRYYTDLQISGGTVQAMPPGYGPTILGRLGVSATEVGPLAPQAAMAQIDAGNPFIVTTMSGPTTGHMFVVNGYGSDGYQLYLSVLDPMSGQHWVPFGQVQMSGYGRWVSTVELN